MNTTPPASSSFGTYLAEINRTPLLSAQEEKDLATGVRAGDGAARDRMVRANLRLVVNIARSYAGRGVPIEDLVSEGSMGLMRAVEGFDPAMNTRFSTYASFWINQSIRRGVVNAAKTIRIPAYLSQLLVKWGRATGELAGERGRPPTREEVAGRLGLTPRQAKAVTEAIRASKGPPSEPGDEAPGIAETVGDTRGRPPAAAMIEAADIGRLPRLLDQLGSRDATVLRMRYGFGGEAPKTLKEIGKHFGLSRERIRQIEVDSLASMAESIRRAE